MTSGFPFRVGTTSYILPADILPNARFLKDQVDDIELVLFELDDGRGNLPAPEVVEELSTLAAVHGLTYTVHLPLDLRLGAGGEASSASLSKARRVIERTRSLEPWAYVLHLEGKDELAALRGGSPRGGGGPVPRPEWVRNSLLALELVAAWAGGPDLLAVENLEGYPLDFLEPVFERLPVSRCVDVGHLWLDGHDPLPYLERALPRARVVHLHGLRERDHRSLELLPRDKLAGVVDLLLRSRYRGVLTLEVFEEGDFRSSLSALQECLKSRWESA